MKFIYQYLIIAFTFRSCESRPHPVRDCVDPSQSHRQPAERMNNFQKRAAYITHIMPLTVFIGAGTASLIADDSCGDFTGDAAFRFASAVVAISAIQIGLFALSSVIASLVALDDDDGIMTAACVLVVAVSVALILDVVWLAWGAVILARGCRDTEQYEMTAVIVAVASLSVIKEFVFSCANVRHDKRS